MHTVNRVLKDQLVTKFRALHCVIITH